MTLRKKSLLFVAAIMAVTIVAIFVIARGVLLGGFFTLEENGVKQDVRRAESALSNEISDLETKAADWSASDDTYNFIQDSNADYVRSNLVDSTFVNLRLNLIVFVDNSGRIVWGKAFDLNRQKESVLPESLFRYLDVNGPLLTHTNPKSRLSGMILLEENPMLITSQPVLTSANEGPIMGTLIEGRYLSSRLVQDMGRQTLLSITLERFDSSSLPADFREARLALATASAVYVQRPDSETVAGYTVVKGIVGNPVLLLKVDEPRDVFKQGEGIVFSIMAIEVLLSLLIGGVAILLLDRWVLSPVLRLDKAISLIGTTGDLSPRVPMAGNDEIGNLALSVNRTLDALQESQTKLRQSEERYRRLAENAPDVIARYDLFPYPHYSYLSPAVFKVTGFTPEEYYHNPDLGKGLVHPDDLLLVESAIRGELPPGAAIQVRWRRADGNYVLMEQRTVPIRDEAGNLVAVECIGQDIGERLLAQAEKERLEQQTQVASRLALIGQMASGIAHEINNPLTSVIGFGQLLVQRPDIPEDAKNEVRIVTESADRVAGIVKRLLTFARQHKPERSYVNINEVISETLDLRSYSLKNSNIVVETSLSPDLPRTMADAGQLQQVFLNLIINAEMAMQMTRGKGCLAIATALADGNIRASVKDDGPGIPKESMDKLFTPFFTTREVGQGTGLGLSICHGIIAEHNGRIYAQSEEGKGAVFIVELPVLPEERPLKPEPAITLPGIVKEARILVVDDEPSVRELLSHVLGLAGHRIDAAEDAGEAFKRIKMEQYDMILLDVKMPGTGGIEVYQELERMSRSLARRVVFITGDVIGAQTRDFLAKTGADCLTKPFDLDQLVKDVNAILAAGRGRYPFSNA